jgi:hypothetical protein
MKQQAENSLFLHLQLSCLLARIDIRRVLGRVCPRFVSHISCLHSCSKGPYNAIQAPNDRGSLGPCTPSPQPAELRRSHLEMPSSPDQNDLGATKPHCDSRRQSTAALHLAFPGGCSFKGRWDSDERQATCDLGHSPQVCQQGILHGGSS